MRQLDLSQCFPLAVDGTRGLLPKQQLFIDRVLDKNGSRYVGYYGGVGSGKSLILCYSVLIQAIMFGGEYAICRQFAPELRRSTAKQFLEMVPRELLIEHRVADNEVHLRCQDGSRAIVYFLQLEEPDKIRSMSLSGFAFDEASQVSEEAFLLLQSRLRNQRGLRKGIVVGNPSGHDWVYNYFVKQDMFKSAVDKRAYSMIVAPSTENKHLPAGYVEGMMASYTEDRIQREIMGSWDAFQGAVFTEFNRQVHVIKPFRIPEQWTRFIGADHGYRNPAAFVWCAVDYDDNVYVYREFYQKEWLIEEILKGKDGEPGVVALNKGDKLDCLVIDPSTRAVRGQKGISDYDVYLEYMPRAWPFGVAQNDVATGIDRVKSYLKIDPKTEKPKLMIFDTCENLLDEILTYRWQEMPAGQQGNKNAKEEPVKKNDHAVDALRYALMTRPEAPISPQASDKVPYMSLQSSIAKELKSIKKPKARDPFMDY